MNNNAAKQMQHVNANSFHLHKARIMSATLQLPDHFEVVILGTGLVESIVAAAAARAGHSVLHVDTASYYGGDWASFTLDGIQRWVQERSETSQVPAGQGAKPSAALPPLEESETFLPAAHLATTQNIREFWSAAAGESAGERNEERTEDGDSRVQSAAGDSIAWTKEKIQEQSRRFSLDLTPRLLYARGEMVELLISSNIARYTEFKSATRVLTQIHGQLEHVPSSRSDVFATRHISVVEKRILMKFLAAAYTTADKPGKTEEERWRVSSQHQTFEEFLRKQQLTENLIHFVVFAIAMVRPDCPAEEGLLQTRKFLSSLGRFGNTPFLWSMYGSGELPQAFCRLCAVYGGIYYLGRSFQGIIVKDSQCVAIVAEGRRISCNKLVLPQSQVPEEIQPAPYPEERISRGIHVTSRSILVSEKEQLTFLSLPGVVPVNLVEISAATGACPRGLQVVHTSCKLPDGVQAEDITARVETVLPVEALLYSLTFTQIALVGDCSTKLDNTWGAPGPTHELDFDLAVGAAKDIYAAMYSGDAFLPRAPDPEEIVLGGEEEEERVELPVAGQEPADQPVTGSGIADQPIAGGETVDQPIADGKVAVDQPIPNSGITDEPMASVETVNESIAGGDMAN